MRSSTRSGSGFGVACLNVSVVLCFLLGPSMGFRTRFVMLVVVTWLDCTRMSCQTV